MSAIKDPRFPLTEDVVLPQIIRKRAAAHPERTFAVFDDGDTWSYAQLAETTWRRAHALIDLGVAPGDYVSAWLPTGPAALETWFGTNAAGAVYAPINLSYKGSLLEHSLDIAESKVLVAHIELISRLADCDLKTLQTLVVVGDGDLGPAQELGLDVVRWDDVISDNTQCPDRVDEVNVWDDMALILTSGTTGPSKGVRCSYLNHYVDSTNTIHPSVTSEDRFFLCVPMFHVGGTKSTYTMLRKGGSIAVTPNFSTSNFWDNVRSLGVTTCFLMAAMTMFLQKQPRTARDSDHTLRTALTGPMPENIEEFTERFGVQVYSNFAMTEMPAVVRTELNPSNHLTCGKLIDPEHYEARLVDEFDQEVPTGTVGELMVRHAWPWALNSGYKGMPEATARAWRNGWFHTGDAHYRDEDGNYFFVDRFKDTLRRRGENISSMEVEAELLTHDSIAQAACVGITSAELEDEVKAFIVLAAGKSVTPQEIVEYLEPRMPYFMIPRYIEICDELPHTPSFKIEKFKLRKRGLTEATWDREAAGMRLRREKFEQRV